MIHCSGNKSTYANFIASKEHPLANPLGHWLVTLNWVTFSLTFGTFLGVEEEESVSGVVDSDSESPLVLLGA